jgi:hypothetical protein
MFPLRSPISFSWFLSTAARIQDPQQDDFLSDGDPQQSSILQQSRPFLPSMELMTAAAQPTPGWTEMASKEQLRLQAPHSMQASRFWILTWVRFISSTLCGQTSRHIPQPVHFSLSSFRETTLLR